MLEGVESDEVDFEARSREKLNDAASSFVHAEPNEHHLGWAGERLTFIREFSVVPIEIFASGRKEDYRDGSYICPVCLAIASVRWIARNTGFSMSLPSKTNRPERSFSNAATTFWA